MIKSAFSGYREIATINHGFVFFRLGYNHKPKHRGDNWCLHIHPYEGDEIKLIMCNKDIGAILILLGLAVKGVKRKKKRN